MGSRREYGIYRYKAYNVDSMSSVSYLQVYCTMISY